MGQKVNPISLRLQKTNRFYESSWYSNKNYNVLLSQDLTIRGYLNSVLKQIRYPQGRFFLKYMHKKVSIFSFLHNPHRSRKERANLLSSQRSLKARSSVVHSKPRGHMTISNVINEAPLEKQKQVLGFFAEGDTKEVTATTLLHSHSKQSSRLRNRLSIVKKSFCYLKNLQNLNKQRVNSLFYMLHGLSSKGPVSLTKQGVSILEKQFYIRYFLASFFSLKNSFSVYPMVLPKFTSLASSLKAQAELTHADNHLKPKKNSNDYDIKISNHWKKNLVNRFLMFRLLEKEAGTLLSTKYSEKPISSSLEDINLEIYPKTKNRFALINRAFSKFYSHFANSDKKNLTTRALGSRADPLILNSSATSLVGSVSRAASRYASVASLVGSASETKTKAGKSNIFGSSSTITLKQPLPTSLTQKQSLNLRDALTSIKKKTSASASTLSKDAAKQVQLNQLVGLKKVSTFIIKDTPYRNHLESVVLKRLNFSVELFPFQAFSDSQSALFLANEIVFYLEQRVAFRRIKTRLFKEIAKKHWIKGIRISCSGRLGGRSKKAQRSKTECVKLGQTSLHVFSSKMDFAYKSALTPFGLVGVKVWISYK